MKRFAFGVLVPALLALGLAAPAAADPPTAFTFSVTFDDLNPCTGLVHTVTIEATVSLHQHDGRIVGRGDRTITTSSGYVGHGSDAFVANGEVEMFRLADILTNDSGDRIRARFVFVLDISSGTVRVETGALSCLGS